MLKLFNTLTRKKETFKSIKKNQVGIYTCGPTVYNHAHIGNLRAYVAADVLQRYLQYSGSKVKWVMNITDVDDKTIRDSKKAKKTLKEFTRKYEELFFEDIEKLNIEKSSFFKNPRATEYIKEMQGIIKKLLKKEFAYEKDGSIYFSIEKYIKSGKKYGRLSNIDLKGFKSTDRIDSDEYEKEDLKDFVLWKKFKKGEPSWDFKIGKENYAGRPGWHIECSAMSEKYLGSSFDIHTGGVDLVFPHHEDEIAQSEGASGKKFSNYFIHNEHLLVNEQKMSKSLGNFYTIEDIMKMIKNPLALRLLFLQSSYRSKLNFTKKSIIGAEKTLDNIYYFITVMLQDMGNGKTNRLENDINKARKKFIRAMDDDLSTSQAIAVVEELINKANKTVLINNQETKSMLDFLLEIDSILGLGFNKAMKGSIATANVLKLIDDREKARKDKDFKKADDIRDKILEKGYEIEDTANGARVRKTK